MEIILYHFFSGNRKAEICGDVVVYLVKSYKSMECNMSWKVHFLDSHLDSFLENLGQWAIGRRAIRGHLHHEKAVPNQVESHYAGLLLPDT